MRWRIVVAAALVVAGSTAAAATAAPDGRRAQAPALDVRPRAAARGGRVVFYGSGFAPQARVALLAGVPGAEPVRIGSARTDAEGGFVAPISIQRDVVPGRYAAFACRHNCRVKATSAFRVLSR
jgi:hypothetical protein